MHTRLYNALAFLVLLLIFSSCTMYQEMQEMKKPRYEVGEHAGAEYCSDCHPEIYEEWVSNSRHAVATTDAAYHSMLNKFTDDFMLDLMMGEGMCYACHGSKDVDEGVNCETCHGTVLPNLTIEETHEQKYTPGMVQMRDEDFCAKCHEMHDPMSGTMIMTVVQEWQQSEAASQGQTCQNCHMDSQGSDHTYHGFDAVIIKDGIYSDDLVVRDIILDFPQLSLVIENRINAHAVPAACETRVLTLEIVLLDSTDAEVHNITQDFAKSFELMLGVMPSELIENTQLQAGEARALTYTLPPSLKGIISRADVTLRFHRVSGEHQDGSKMYDWTSEPILHLQLSL